jgi:hypothetical protein
MEFLCQIKEQAKHVVEEEAKLLAPLEQVRALISTKLLFSKSNTCFHSLLHDNFLMQDSM